MSVGVPQTSQTSSEPDKDISTPVAATSKEQTGIRRENSGIGTKVKGAFHVFHGLGETLRGTLLTPFGKEEGHGIVEAGRQETSEGMAVFQNKPISDAQANPDTPNPSTLPSAVGPPPLDSQPTTAQPDPSASGHPQSQKSATADAPGIPPMTSQVPHDTGIPEKGPSSPVPQHAQPGTQQARAQANEDKEPVAASTSFGPRPGGPVVDYGSGSDAKTQPHPGSASPSL